MECDTSFLCSSERSGASRQIIVCNRVVALSRFTSSSDEPLKWQFVDQFVSESGVGVLALLSKVFTSPAGKCNTMCLKQQTNARIIRNS